MTKDQILVGSEIVPANEPHELEERSIDEVKNQVIKIQELLKSLLKKDEHYGTIPGTQKPSLLKPGAEKICFTFRLIPRFKITRHDLENGHREYEVICDLHNSQTNICLGQGVGSCSTMESKYRWRRNQRVCPNCGAEAIKRSHYPDEKTGVKGWYCHAKIGGCNGKFGYNDPRIQEQEIGKVENPDIADQYNTVLKMAKKRSHVDATITATAASDVFTQDVEDFDHISEVQSPGGKSVNPKTEMSEQRATDKQIQKLWATAGDRADQIGSVREVIMRDVLKALKLEESTHAIPRKRVDDVLNAIMEYEPIIHDDNIDDGTPF